MQIAERDLTRASVPPRNAAAGLMSFIGCPGVSLTRGAGQIGEFHSRYLPIERDNSRIRERGGGSDRVSGFSTCGSDRRRWTDGVL